MFVKKFEAPSLELALLSIKQELGPNALILSTIEKKGKWFNKPIIEVTAAYDAAAPVPEESQGTQRQKAASDSGYGEEELRKIFPHRRKGQAHAEHHEESKPTLGKRPQETMKYAEITGSRKEPRVSEPGLGRDFTDMGMSPRVAEDLGRRLRNEYSKADLEKPEHAERAKIRLIAESLSTVTRESLTLKKRWLVVGAPGVGKTTVAAKLAILLRSEGQAVRLGSYDKRKLLGRRELASYARLLQVPFENSNEERADSVLLLDTPSLAITGTTGFSERWAELKANSKGACVLFVCDATARSEEVIHAIEIMRAQAHIQALVFTRADCSTRLGMIYDVIRHTRLPCLAVSYSQGFQSALRFLSSAELATAIVRHGITVKGVA